MNIITRPAAVGLTFMLLSSVYAAPSENELMKAAKLSRSEAARIAVSKVPHGRVAASELEREHGKLIWSFDIAKPGTRDISEVQVDARTGKIVSVANETPSAQEKEAKKDRARTH